MIRKTDDGDFVHLVNSVPRKFHVAGSTRRAQAHAHQRPATHANESATRRTDLRTEAIMMGGVTITEGRSCQDACETAQATAPLRPPQRGG